MPGREVGAILIVDCNPVGGAGSASGPPAGSQRSWQMLGSSQPFEHIEAATIINEAGKKTLVQGCGRTSSHGGDHGPGFEGPRSTGPRSTAPEGPKAMEEEKEEVDFFDSVSCVGRGGLGVRPRSNMTTASSVPGQRVGGTMNASALSARFMVDARIFEWTPQSVEEYLNCGQVPNGLTLGGQCHISALALGYDAEHNQYDAKSQIYNSAVWTKQLGSALMVPSCAMWHTNICLWDFFSF